MKLHILNFNNELQNNDKYFVIILKHYLWEVNIFTYIMNFTIPNNIFQICIIYINFKILGIYLF